jgi:hypothetical protein
VICTNSGLCAGVVAISENAMNDLADATQSAAPTVNLLPGGSTGNVVTKNLLKVLFVNIYHVL